LNREFPFSAMAYKAKKTEHSGSKKGRGAYYGPKRDAKRESSRARRHAARKRVKADPPDDPFLTIGARATPRPKDRTTPADVDAILYRCR
jgi:hypothetical protein